MTLVEARHIEAFLKSGRFKGDDGDVVLAKCFLLVDPWNTCTVESVCVHPEQRGRGLCKAMLGSLIALLLLLRRRRSKQPRFRALRIYCYANNARACGCYRSVFGPPVHETEGTVAFEVRFEDPGFIRPRARGTTRSAASRARTAARAR